MPMAPEERDEFIDQLAKRKIEPTNPRTAALLTELSECNSKHGECLARHAKLRKRELQNKIERRQLDADMRQSESMVNGIENLILQAEGKL